MENLMTIYDVLAAPAGAQLVSNHGELALVVIDRPHDRKVSVELFPLGNAVTAAEVLKLFDVLGLLPTTVPAPAGDAATAPLPRRRRDATMASPAPSPRVPGPGTAAGAICPQCGATYKNRSGLASHLRTHGPAAGPLPVSCPQCGRSFKNAHALEVHVGWKHGGEAAPAVAAVSDAEPATDAGPSIDTGARDTDPLPAAAFAVSTDETPAPSDLDQQIVYTQTNIEAAARLGATDADLDPARRELLRLCRLRAAQRHANGRQPVEAA